MSARFAIVLLGLLLALSIEACEEHPSPRASAAGTSISISGGAAEPVGLSFGDGSTGKSEDCDLELVPDNDPFIPDTLRRGSVQSFEEMGRWFLEGLVEQGLVDRDGYGYNRLAKNLNSVDGSWKRFKKYCHAAPGELERAALCRFGNRGVSIPLQVKYWTLVYRQSGEKVSWLTLARANSGSKFGWNEISSRWTTRLPNFQHVLWMGLESKIADISATHTADTTDHIKVNVRWNGYVVKATADTLQMLAYKIPIMREHRGGSLEYKRGELPVRSHTQVDVALPRPGIMKVTAVTDSLTEEQRCWLGTHVIDSTAAGLR